MGSPQRLARWSDLLLCKLKFPTEHFCHSNAHKDCLAERLPAESKFHIKVGCEEQQERGDVIRGDMELQTNPFLHRWPTHMSRNSYLVFVKPKAIVCAQICVKGTHCADQYMAIVLYLICKWQKYIDTHTSTLYKFLSRCKCAVMVNCNL